MRETVVRSLSGAAYVLLLSAAVFYSSLTFYILFGVFLILAVWEFCALVNLNKIIPVLISIILYSLAACFRGNDAFDLSITVMTLLASVFAIYFLFDGDAEVKRTLQKRIFLFGYIILPFIIIAKIPFIKDVYDPWIIFGIFVLVWVNDTFAFIIGKTLGRTKLMERISPKKTVEGFLGGLVFSVAAAIIIAIYYRSEPVFIWILIALIMSVLGTTGDLIESKFKRLAQVKDSGSIMPGHGGILDRLDSVIFAAPFVFLLFQILKYVS